ncbi:MAG: HAMP domain-containing protein [Planctomycetes bacterium]|nr:HAMP domain-containing protein [Planctomycetota bacterium]
MRLRSKVLLAVVLGSAGLSAGLYVATDALVMSGLRESEHGEAAQKVRATVATVDTMLQEHLLRTTDWAEWDDAARLLNDDYPDFAEANLIVSGLASLRWDVVQVVRLDDGKVCAAAALDVARQQFVAADPGLLAHLHDRSVHYRAGAPRVGLCCVGDTIWITSSRDVLRSDQGAPPRPGRLLTASRVDAEWLHRLRQFTRLDANLRRATEPPADDVEADARRELAAAPDQVATRAVSAAAVAAFGWLPDLYGRPGVLLRIDVGRPLLAVGQRILRSAMFTIAGAGALLLLLSWGFVARLLRRLGTLLRAVEALRAGEQPPRPKTVADELGELTEAFHDMAEGILERERSLTAMHERLRLVLDSTGDGMLACGLDGTVLPGGSKCAELWFGPGATRKVWDLLFGDDPRAAEFELGVQQIQDGFLPFELLADQLPRQLARSGRHFELEVGRIEKDSALVGLLVVVKDATARLETERAEREARELQAVVGNLLRDPADFERFLDEMQGLLAGALHAESEAERRRALHTMKGSASVYGFGGYAASCHRVEDALAQGLPIDGFAAELQQHWDAAVQRIRTFLPEQARERIVLTAAEHAGFLARLCAGEPPGRLVAIVESWRQRPAAAVLDRFARHALRVADKLGKRVEVEVHGGDLRIDHEALAPLLEAFVHVVSNAVDHGIEPEAQRRARGKPPRGRIAISARIERQLLLLAVEDDGGGIDWDAVAAAARRRGLPAATHDDLVAALFADGLSTRDEATAISGRGVGLAAVRAGCLGLGGTIEVTSRPGSGTSFAFRLPLPAALALVAAGS